MTNEAKLSRFSKDDEYTPFVVITYRYNPADTIGKFVKQRSEYYTTRGTRVHVRVSQTWKANAGLDDYSRYIKAFDKIFHGVNNVSKIRSIPDSFAIVIGIVNPSLYHDGYASGGDIDYSDLFELLSYRGFDPLKSIRNKKIQLSEELGLRIRNVVNRGGLSKNAILTIVRNFATELCDKAKDYIYGGSKPTLKENTIRWRDSKLQKDKSLYKGKRGIAEPMFETGQLHDAIGWDAIAYQSREMAAFANDLVKSANEIRRSKRDRERQQNERRAKSILESKIDAKINELTERASGQYSRDQISKMLLTLMRKPRIVGPQKARFESSKISRIPVSPTEKQIESLERRLFSFVGLRKVDIRRKIKLAKMRVGNTAEILSRDYSKTIEKKFKRQMRNVVHLESLLKKHRSGFYIKEIGHTSVGLAGDVSSKAVGGRVVNPVNSDIESALLGIAKKYREMEMLNKPASEIFLHMYNEEKASRDDVRLALILDDAIKRYGREF